MAKVSFRAIPKKFNNGSYLLLPATALDRSNLNQFCDGVNNHYVTVTVNFARGNKSWDQCKAVFVLINLRFQLQYHRNPTDTEKALVYSSFLNKYADREPNPLNPEETEAISLSAMSKSQAASFIGSIIADIYEYAGNTLTDTQQIELKEVFEEFAAANAYGVGNPIDYDKEGNLLSMEEWREKNHFSFASGVDTPDLQLHHIMTRNSKPQLAGVAWNWIMLTEEEHMRIIHAKGGWKKFILIFPHTAKRIKNAYDMAHEMYPREIQEAFIEIGLIDKNSDEITEESTGPSFDDMAPVVKDNTESLAEQALSAQEDKYEGDIF
jgi:hypothetical protein